MQTSKRAAGIFNVSILAAVFLSTHFIEVRTSEAQRVCFGCRAVYPNVSVRVTSASWLVLAECVQAPTPKNSKQNSATVFKITKIEKNSDSVVKIGDEISYPTQRRKGDRVLFVGARYSKKSQVEWDPLAQTPASIAYCLACSKLKNTPIEHLKFYAKHLEHSDVLVATDAYDTMKGMPIKELRRFAKTEDGSFRSKLLKWTTDDTTARREFYGLLLGLCGNSDDAKQLEQTILKPTTVTNFRPGLQGVVIGYMLLAGEPGLNVVDKHVLKKREIAFSEIYAALQALRVLWNFESRPIKRERILQSIQILLNNPLMTDLVVADLARFEAWNLQEEIVALYGKKGFDAPVIKRAIIRYLIISSGESEELIDGTVEKLADHQIKALEHLKVIRKRDPKIAAETKRFFINVNSGKSSKQE